MNSYNVAGTPSAYTVWEYHKGDHFGPDFLVTPKLEIVMRGYFATKKKALACSIGTINGVIYGPKGIVAVRDYEVRGRLVVYGWRGGNNPFIPDATIFLLDPCPVCGQLIPNPESHYCAASTATTGDLE